MRENHTLIECTSAGCFVACLSCHELCNITGGFLGVSIWFLRLVPALLFTRAFPYLALCSGSDTPCALSRRDRMAAINSMKGTRPERRITTAVLEARGQFNFKKSGPELLAFSSFISYCFARIDKCLLAMIHAH